MEPTGASGARGLQPAIQPNPALVPNYVVHGRVPRYTADMSDETRGLMGSPIPFTPIPTGVQYPERGVSRAASPPVQPMLKLAAQAAQRNSLPPPAVSAPPWQEFRAHNQAPMPEMLRRSVASGTAAFNISFRKGAHLPSIGGSPPSTDEDNPLDPTIPAAARTHVARPPVFSGGSDSATRSVTGLPPAGFRVGVGYRRGDEYGRR